MTDVSLTRVPLPDFGAPTVEPEVPAATYEARIEEARRRMRAAGLDALIVYGDREHCGNLSYLTGYDPRFEEALLVLAGDGPPHLLIGNEGVGYLPVVKAAVRPTLYQNFSLMGQPRDRSPDLADALRDAGLAEGCTAGLVGWKAFGAADPIGWSTVPAFIADTVRLLAGRVGDATRLFMDPALGLRSILDADQLMAQEFASTHASIGVRELILGIQPGMTEREAATLFGWSGMPLAFHPVVSTGPMTAIALVSPTARVIEEGDRLLAAYGPWSSNSARAGFVATGPEALPEAERDYAETMVNPFFDAVATWYETVGIGVPGGVLFDAVHRHLGGAFKALELNPGHLIHIEEWTSTPFYAGSRDVLASGMALQMDMIPRAAPPYFTSNCEDGLCLADEELRAEIATRYPEAWARIEARRRFMAEGLGIRLKPEVLPFSNIQAWLPPFVLDPELIAVRR